MADFLSAVYRNRSACSDTSAEIFKIMNCHAKTVPPVSTGAPADDRSFSAIGYPQPLSPPSVKPSRSGP
jgi:hypothetical protein